ncbi:ribonuclease III [Arachidicoccus rhizosphaerae]|uniref:ribonuclease III n=1 Tax=Arachidicoccus rhizosphaerae TaxID=551991 RepID=UPI001FCD4AD4|nr:ribonuclease III [Arachidicoccus rhizosphaerae]
MQKSVQNIVGKLTSRPSLKKQISLILGIKPKHVALYERALSHRSVSEEVAENNERLEYLGDAVLGTIVADYLFKKYPYKDEGFLTEMRSKMVNRHQLNDIAIKMGLKTLTRFNTADNALRNSQIFGNTLEALVGAIYLDKGYEKTRKWIMIQILNPYLSVDELEQVEINLKNKLIGWAGRNNKDIQFETVDESSEGKRRVFTVAIILDGEKIAEGRGFNKKDAGQMAVAEAAKTIPL